MCHRCCICHLGMKKAPTLDSGEGNGHCH
uniref:Uncharacterized protein n=1 Tax=Arundo donax TaxID=35708 RepID=A0A0A9H9Q6_ARUDO